MDEGAVGDIIRQREEARKSRDYRTADGLRVSHPYLTLTPNAKP